MNIIMLALRIFNALRNAGIAGVFNNILHIVREVERIEDLDGDGKWDEVWERINNDSALREKLKDTSTSAINLAIEAALAIIKSR